MCQQLKTKLKSHIRTWHTCRKCSGAQIVSHNDKTFTWNIYGNYTLLSPKCLLINFAKCSPLMYLICFPYNIYSWQLKHDWLMSAKLAIPSHCWSKTIIFFQFQPNLGSRVKILWFGHSPSTLTTFVFCAESVSFKMYLATQHATMQ